MKTKEIREMSFDEMQGKINDLKHELFNLKFQHSINQLENPKKITHTKRDIAKTKTIMNQIESGKN